MGLADGHPSGSGEDLKNSSLDRVRDFTRGSPHQEAALWEPDPEETHPPHAECAFSRGALATCRARPSASYSLVTHSNTNSY